MNSNLDDLEEMLSFFDGECPADDDCKYEYIDYEKQVKDITEYLKDEHPAIYADMILKDIVK